MPYITTDILCNGETWLSKTDIQIGEDKPSAYDQQTFVWGRIELPSHFQMNLNSTFAVKVSPPPEQMVPVRPEIETVGGATTVTFAVSE